MSVHKLWGDDNTLLIYKRLHFSKNCPYILKRLSFTLGNGLSIIYWHGFIYNKSRNVAYRIVPKAACTSLNSSVLNVNSDDVLDVHTASWMYKVSSDQLESNTFVFTYVRNPYKRILSCYLNMKYGSHGINDTISNGITAYLTKSSTFRNFLLRFIFMPKFLLDFHLMPQSYILKYDLNRINFLDKLENISNTFPNIKNRFGLNSLPHYNESNLPNDAPEVQYTKFLKLLVYIKYRKDFKMFGYKR